MCSTLFPKQKRMVIVPPDEDTITKKLKELKNNW